MKGPRYVVGFLLTMVMWGISSFAALGLRVAAFMMDYEKDYKKIRDEVDAIHEAQENTVPGQCALCGGPK